MGGLQALAGLAIGPRLGAERNSGASLYRDRPGEISGFVHLTIAQDRNMVREELQSQHRPSSVGRLPRL